MRVALLAAFLIARVAAADGQANRGSISGVLFDPVSAAFANAEISLTGIDVRDSYVARTGNDGHYEFKRVAPGSYRVAVRGSGIVPIASVLTVGADTRQTLDIRTAVQVRMALGLSPASIKVLRRWTSGGAAPQQPLEWECTSNGSQCLAPSQSLGEIMMNAFARMDERSGIVEMTGIITMDGFLTGASINSASSEELGAAAIAETSRLRWEPARYRENPAITSATLLIRF